MKKVAAALFLWAAGLAGADFSGIWVGQLPTRNGEFVDIAFQFTHKGGVLGGKLYGDYKSTPITQGVVYEDNLTFIVVVQEQSGNQINDNRVRFTGAMKDGAIELVREREASITAGNGEKAFFRGNAKQVVKLKRLS